VITSLRIPGVFTLMLGHFTVDSFVGVLPVLYPLLIDRFDLNLGTVGLVSLAYVGVSSLSQPFFGHLADRIGTRRAGFALAWTALTFAAVGFMPSFPLLVLAAAIAGLGSGAFHPFGALAVSRLLPQRARNTGMSVYVTGGTLGVACGPLIGVAAFAAFGPQGTALLLIPGLALSALVTRNMRAGAEVRARTMDPRARRSVPWIPLAVTIAVAMSRSWTISTLQAFIPTWFHELGYEPWFYGSLATTIVLASAVGTIGSGSLADRYGRKAVVVGALVLSVPAVWLFVSFPGPQAFVFGALVGLLAASTGPLMLMIAQELMAARAGMASGLILGLGFVGGAIGVPVTGAIADQVGLSAALLLQVPIVAATILVALFLPSEHFLRARGVPTDRADELAAAAQ
jgi:FSR family fosmidomycin resistance protein-like MFS transporter